MNRLLLRGGTVLDGTRGAVPTKCDILIEGERISRVATNVRAPRAHVLQAEGLTVSPGFIDVHAHSDTTALLDSSAQGRIFDGVTTEINGMCGFSLFPLTGPAATGRRASLQHKGIEADWSNADGYLARVEAVGSVINRGFFVGHGAIRAAVIGYEARPARPGEIRLMEALLDDALEQGAIGLSSGLCYVPGCFANMSELVALCRRTAAAGRPYSTHIRSESRRLMGAAREAIRTARASGASLHISHVKARGRANWRKMEALERALFDAQAGGLDITGDRYPYTAAMTDLATIFPDRLMAGGNEAAMSQLRDPKTRKELKHEVEQTRQRKIRWDEIRISNASEAGREFEGLTVAVAAASMGLEPCEVVFELLLRAKMAVTAIFFDMCEENLERILQWPFIFIGSDSAARSPDGPTAEGRPHPRTFGTFSRFLSEYVMRRKLVSLPDAIARMTSLPAARFGLKDRGVLREGAYADIVVFDKDNVRDMATYTDPFRLSKGVRHLIVNGRPVIENGKMTGSGQGKILRAT